PKEKPSRFPERAGGSLQGGSGGNLGAGDPISFSLFGSDLLGCLRLIADGRDRIGRSVAGDDLLTLGLFLGFLLGPLFHHLFLGRGGLTLAAERTARIG